jgi:beta-lactamase regulating signal transducer with metallopeptidase domain
MAESVMAEVGTVGVSLARWLSAGALDGTLLAAAAWLASVTLLRRSSGRVLALLWLGVLVEFLLLRPVQMRPVQMFAVPQLAVLEAQGFAAMSLASPSPGYALLVFAYGAVVSFLLARLVIRQRRLRGRIRSLRPAEPVVLATVRAAARRLSLTRLPEVRITDAPISPFTLGPLQPTLVLPRWLCLPGARLDAVLLHELAHLERRDHLLIWLERGVASLFFFWPPVHWVCRKLDEARELACDERAIQCGAFPAVEYGQHLLAVVALARERLAVGGALSIANSAWRLERRIDRLLQGAWSERRSWLEGAALCLLAVCALLGVRPAPALGLAASAPGAVAVAAGLPASSVLPDESLMSIDESQLPSCARQGCGTQCVP